VAGPGRRDPRAVRTSFEFQKIVDKDGTKVGYELFYRDRETATSAAERSAAATMSVLAGLTAPTKDDLHRGFVVFVNVTREFVVNDLGLPDPSEIAVLEIQPDVYADAAVLAGAERLRAKGYGVGVERYAPGRDNNHDALLPLASHVKLDLEGGDERTLRETVRRVRDHSNALIVGCRIGSQQSLELAKAVGCDLFQGHVFDTKQRQMQRTVSGSLSHYVRLLKLLGDDDGYDPRQATEEVMHDADLSLRVLRACNSAALGLAQEVTSVQQAVILLGPRQLHRVATLAIAQGMGVQAEHRLTQIIEYAMLTDLVGVKHGVAAGTGFLAGLVLEVAEDLETPVEMLIKDLPLAPELARDLRDRRGAVGSTLDVVDAYKRGTGHPATGMADIADLHGQAVLGAAGVIAMTGDADPDAPRPELPPVRRPSAPEPAEPAADAAPASDLTEQQRHRRFRDGSMPLAELASMLGLDEARVTALADRGAVICHDVNGVRYAPVWQFTVDGRLIDGIADVVRDFPGDAVAAAEWLTQPCRGLSRRIPLTLLLQNWVGEVTRHVRGLRRR